MGRHSQPSRFAHSFALASGGNVGVHRSHGPELNRAESGRRIQALGGVSVLAGLPSCEKEKNDGEEEESGTEGTTGVMRCDNFDDDDDYDDDDDDHGVDGDDGESTLFESFLSVRSVSLAPNEKTLLSTAFTIYVDECFRFTFHMLQVPNTGSWFVCRSVEN